MSISNPKRGSAFIALAAVAMAVLAAQAAQARVIYVDIDNTGTELGTSWRYAFSTVQEAVNDADPSDEIWVAEGTYVGGGIKFPTLPAVTMVYMVAIYGGFDGRETLRIQRNWNDHPTILQGGSLVNHVVIAAGRGRLDGFQIQGGNADGTDEDAHGGGLHANGVTQITIANCRFVSNHGDGLGGAVRVIDGGLTFTSCVFDNNHAGMFGGAVSCVGTSTVNFNDCSFLNNSSDSAGGAMLLATGTTNLSRCRFEQNDAGGAAGAIFSSSSATLVGSNCIFFDNHSVGDGAAIFNNVSGSINFSNSTFAMNVADSEAGCALRAEGTTTSTLTNCILWNAAGTEISKAATGPVVTVAYSNVWKNYSGTGNIYVTPGFVDYYNGDLHIVSSSLCIDAAHRNYAPAYDFDYYERVDYGAFGGSGVGPPWADMGAYEYTGSTLEVSIDDASITEGQSGTKMLQFEVAMLTSLGIDFTVDWATASSSAVAGSDFVSKSDTLTIPAGDTFGYIDVQIIGDTTYEGHEVFYVNLSNASSGVLIDSQGKGTITNDDSRPDVEFTVEQDVNESTAQATVTVTQSGLSGFNTIVPFTVSGSATSADHGADDASITISAGNLTGSYVFDIIDDSLDEDNETVVFTMGTPTNADPGPQTVHTVFILDNDLMPKVNFATNQTLTEDDVTVEVEVSLTALSGRAVTVPFSVSGTAVYPNDHDAQNSSITIPAGEWGALYAFHVLEDALDEPNETIVFSMGTLINATEGTSTSQTVTITDDDPLPGVNFAVDQSVAENVGTVTVTVNLTEPSGRIVSIDLTVSGSADPSSDYTATGLNIQIPAGATSGTYQFTVINDLTDEPDETVEFTLGALTNAEPDVVTTHTVTITDNDDPPTLDFEADQTVDEDAGSVTVLISFSERSAFAVTLPYSVGGSATAMEDHDASGTTIVIPPDTADAFIAFNILEDALHEASETVVFTMGVPTNATTGDATHIVNITDNDDSPTVSFGPDQDASEGAGTVGIFVGLDAPSGLPVSVPFTVSGTALNPDDHNLVGGFVVIPAGSEALSLPFTIVNDSLDENNETVIVTMGSVTNASIGDGTHQVTITDNDPTPSANFAAAQSVDEGDGGVTVTVTLTSASSFDVIVPFTVGGSAGYPSDHNAQNSSISIPPGGTSGTYGFTVAEDALDESSETVVFSMGTPVNADPGTVLSHMVTIDDNDATPTVNFAADQGIDEDPTTVTVLAILGDPSGLVVTIPFTVDGTATGADHTASNGSIVISAGLSSAAYQFNLTEDTLFELDETVRFTMGSVINAVKGDDVHVVTIQNDDAEPTVQWSSPALSVAESVGTVYVVAELSAASGLAVTVPFSVGGSASPGSDFTTPVSPLTISAGASSASVAVPIIDDPTAEGAETIVLTMAGPTNATVLGNDVHTLTIEANDSTSTSTIDWLIDAQITPGESGTIDVIAILTTGDCPGGCTVNYSVSGTAGGLDHNASSGTIVFPPGTVVNDTVSVPVTITTDALYEGNETAIFTLTSIASGIAQLGSTYVVHTMTITDDNAPPVVSLDTDFGVTEAVGAVAVTATLSAQSGLDVTVPLTIGGSAVAPADFSAAGTEIVIPAGQGSATTQFTVVDDAIHEDPETVVYTMGAIVNATEGNGSLTVTISDNDNQPTVDFEADRAVSEGVGSVTITATLDDPSGLDVTVPFTVSGSATAGGIDHAAAANTILIAAGNTSGTYIFAVNPDTLDEPSETVVFTMGSVGDATEGKDTLIITITDDDDTPTVYFSTDAQDIDEDTVPVTVVVNVTLSAASSYDVTVPITVSGTASGTTDHNAASGDFTVPAGDLGGVYQFEVTVDATDEDDETVILTMGAPTNADLGATTVQTITINDDDDPPAVSFEADKDVPEAAGTVTVTATLSLISAWNVSVPFTVAGTASSSTDHNAAAGTISIPAGTISATTQFTVINDSIDEDDETVEFLMGTLVNATAGDPTHISTIIDNDAAPVANFAVNQSVTEGAANATVSVQLSAVSGLDITIPYAVSGTATPTADHLAVAGEIQIAAGATTGSYQFGIVEDLLDEISETVVFTMSGPTNATVGNGTHTVTITDNDPTPTVTFTTEQSVDEDAGTVSVSATLSAASSMNVVVPYTVSGTAANPNDHLATNGSIVIDAGFTSEAYEFTLVDDAINELGETIIFSMGGPQNAGQGAVTTHTVNIADNDPEPTVDFAADQSPDESAGTVTVTIALSSLSGRNVTVPYAVSGTATVPDDHHAADGNLTILAGAPSGSFTFDVENDNLDEDPETVIFTMGTPNGAGQGSATTHTVTIQDDDDPPTIAFETDTSFAEDAGTATITATLTPASGLDVTVPVTLGGTATGSGTDYDVTTPSITILAGATTGTVQVDIAEDVIDEPNETVILTMGTPMNATVGVGTHQLTITDNDATPTVDFDADQAVDEDAGTVTVTATLSAASGRTVTVPFVVGGTADNLEDHNATGTTLTIPVGSTTAQYQFAVADDDLDEDPETVVLAIGTPINAVKGYSPHTVTINDNDPEPTVQWTADAQSAGESIGTVTLTAQITEVSGRDVTVDLAATGDATGGGADYDDPSATLTIAQGDTTADLVLTIIDDGDIESSETVILTMSAPTSATLGATTAHTVTIGDNDGTGAALNWTVASQSVAENTTTVTLTVILSDEPATDDITAEYAVSGTAGVGGVDHDAASGTVSFASGDPIGTTTDITFNVVNDMLNENDETVIFSLTAIQSGPGKLGTSVTHTVTITDDDPLPTADFAVDQTVAEGVGAVTVAASLDTASGRAVSIPFSVGGTASGASDHTAGAGTINIPAGQTLGSYVFNVTNDVLFEANETITFSMLVASLVNAQGGTATVHTVTVSDNDTAPTVDLAADQEVGEGDGAVSVTVILDAVSGVNATIPFTVGGTAISPDDHDAANGTITINAGSTTGTYSFDVVDDDLNELDETVEFTITVGSLGNATAGSATVHVVTITNDDVAPVADFSVDQSVAEDVGTVTVAVDLSAASGLVVTVPFTIGGSATGGGVDHDAAGGSIAIPAGATAATYEFDVASDALYEADETIVFTMGTPTNAAQGSLTTHIVTITDGDPEPTVEWTTDAQQVGEPIGTVTVTAELSAVSGLNVNVPFTLTGTASGGGGDYIDPVASIDIPAGSLTATVSISVVDDALDESAGPAETIILTIGTPINATTGSTDVHTISILDNDAVGVPTIEWTAIAQTVGEGVGSLTVALSLDLAPATAIDISYTVTGTAVSPDDYDALSGLLTVPIDATSAELVIMIVDDDMDEGNDTIVLTMTDVTTANANLGTTIVHTVTITDNDSAPTVSFAADQTVTEGDGTVIVTATLAAVSALNVTVPFTVGGTANNPQDHNAVAGSIVIIGGDLSGTYEFSLANDDTAETNETVGFAMGAPTNATPGTGIVHIVTIVDDDSRPTVQWTADSQTVGENDGSVTLTAQLSRAAPQATSVVYTVSGDAVYPDEHNAANGVVTFAVGQSTRDIVIALYDDAIEEIAESIILDLAFVTTANADLGSTLTHTITVTDDDTIAPVTVVSTTPTDTATDQLTTVAVSVTFSTQMEPVVTEAAFALTSSAGSVSGAFSWNAGGTEMTFTPAAALDTATVYTATVGADSESDAGTTLGTDDTFTFTTVDAVSVVSTTPLDGSIGHPTSVTVSVTFSDEMDQSATEDVFAISSASGAVEGILSWNVGDTIMTFTPTAALETGTIYTVVIGAASASSTGVTLDGDYTFTFITVDAWAGVYAGGCTAGHGGGSSSLILVAFFAMAAIGLRTRFVGRRCRTNHQE